VQTFTYSSTGGLPFRNSAATVPELCSNRSGSLQQPFRIFFLSFRNSARGVPGLCVKSYRYRSGSFFYRSGTLQQPFRNSAETVPEVCACAYVLKKIMHDFHVTVWLTVSQPSLCIHYVYIHMSLFQVLFRFTFEILICSLTAKI